MTWQAQSTRRAELPPDWERRRQTVKARAHGKCEWNKPDGTRCGSWGNQCDHIVRGNNHSLDNLQWLCPTHHAIKTAAEAAAAKPRRNRPPEPHPGLKAIGGEPQPPIGGRDR